MIYAFSVIKGYNSMRGNMFLHISMAIVMLVFIRVPKVSSDKTNSLFTAWWNDEEEVIDKHGEIETFPAADLWYTYNVVLHFLAAIV